MADSRAATRLAAAVRRSGATVTLRRFTSTGGSAPLLNPPSVAELVCAAPAAAGATTITLDASVAQGILLPGDTLVLPQFSAIVAAPAPARPVTAPTPGFDGVAVLPLGGALAAGAGATLRSVADQDVPAVIASYPDRLVDGQRIMAADLSILVPAYVGKPDASWKIIFEGRTLAIVNATPAYKRAEVMSYSIQAR